MTIKTNRVRSFFMVGACRHLGDRGFRSKPAMSRTNFELRNISAVDLFEFAVKSSVSLTPYMRTLFAIACLTTLASVAYGQVDLTQEPTVLAVSKAMPAVVNIN